MEYSDNIKVLLEKLIDDGNSLLRGANGDLIRDSDGLRRWSNELILFQNLAADMIHPWRSRLDHSGTVLLISAVKTPLSALETIKFAIENDLLTSYRELIYSEAFADLYEQGQHLFNQGYYLAAGVIFRAVLEEKLRNLCIQNNCMPEKQRPTINDLNQALYKSNLPGYGKSMMLNVSALAAVGNDAAHNNPNLQLDDVERLMNGTLDFISRYSPS